MNDKKWLPRLLLAFLTLSGAAYAASPTYQTQTLEGWTVNVDSRLPATNKAATDKALGLLTEQLRNIVQVVPAGPVAQLRKVPLWLSPPYAGLPPRAEYHTSPIWLSQNGRNPAMARGIEISNVLVYEAESKRMPLFVLHELAHAYQDQFLGAAGNAEVQAAFDRATAKRPVPGQHREQPAPPRQHGRRPGATVEGDAGGQRHLPADEPGPGRDPVAGHPE